MTISGAGSPIEPFYFRPDRPLFACYHRPQRQPPRACAVVLCYPMGDEYIRFYRAMRQLAVQLAGSGFPVLRFDWYGCGDSAGEAEEWRLAQWQADLAAAIDEARRRSGSPHVVLAGLHLGATLAATVAATRQDIAATALWDPVLSGEAHLRELHDLQASMLRRAHVLPQPPGQHTPATLEVLGFALSADMRADIAAIDVLAVTGRPAPRVMLVESNPQIKQATLARRLEELGADTQFVAMANPPLWVWEEGVDTVAVPHSILQAITAWLAGVCP